MPARLDCCPSHARRRRAWRARQWAANLTTAGAHLHIAEIADYEVRRELLRARKRRGVERLNQLKARALHEALEPFVDLRKLRQLAASGADLQGPLTIGEVPDDVQALIAFVAELLRPVQRDQVKSPVDAVAFLMARMGLLDQEELWTMCAALA